MERPSVSSRDRILEFVRAHPGSHLREIARVLGLPLGTALYHLDSLTGGDVLVARRDGRYKRFFVRHALGRAEIQHVSALRHQVPRRIVEALLAGPALTQRELAAIAGVSRSTLSFHATRLVADGLLLCEERRPENRYRLADPEVAGRLLATYRTSFEGARADPFALHRGPRVELVHAD